MTELLDVAIGAARQAGAELLQRYGSPPRGVKAKSRPGDLVSDADLAAERVITRALAERRPGDGVLAEEATSNRPSETGLRWVVDPLDGTANFLLEMPLWCVSIACEDARGTCTGVIFDPLRDELFTASRGGPALRNGTPLIPTCPASLGAACVGGSVQSLTSAEAQRYGTVADRLYRRVGQRRSLGSAALELAWTAAGRLGLCYQEQNNHPWDVDAGLMICERAGLRVHRFPPAGGGLARRYLAAPRTLAAAVIDAIVAGELDRPVSR